MRMPKYEKLRNARLYGAIHPPKASRISAVLNSPYSSGFSLHLSRRPEVTSVRQKCMSDADTAADRVDLLENERWKREYYFKHALATKQTFAEVREAKDQHVPSSSDFKSKTPWDLQVEQFHILRRAVPGDDRPFRKQGFFSEKLVEDIASDPHSTVMRILSEDDYKMPDTIFKLSSNCSPRAVFRQILTGEQYVLRGAMQPVPVKLPDVRKIP